jgi:hypothetical protein
VAWGFVAVCAVVALLAPVTTAANPSSVYRIDHVADGDTIILRNGQRARLVQIDTPEVYFGTECYGKAASALTKWLLPPGTPVRLLVEPATALRQEPTICGDSLLSVRNASERTPTPRAAGDVGGELVRKLYGPRCPPNRFHSPPRTRRNAKHG